MKNRKTIRLSLSTLGLLAGLASAQPMTVQTAPRGLLLGGFDYATLIEAGSLREPGTTRCPFAYSGPSPATIRESVQTIDGRTFCAWELRVTERRAKSGWVKISDGTQLHLLRVAQEPPPGWPGIIFQTADWTFRPCDIDLNGTVQSADLLRFAAMPYDWDGDGVVTVRDFMAVLNGCR